MLKRAKGNYTPKQILRCAQISGAFGRQLDRIFTRSGLGSMDTKRDKVRDKAFQRDLPLFVEVYTGGHLCRYTQARRPHKGFTAIEVDPHITNSIGMGQKMVESKRHHSTLLALKRYYFVWPLSLMGSTYVEHVEVMGYCLLVANHYWHQCSFVISAGLYHQHEIHLVWSSEHITLYNACENAPFHISGTSSGDYWILMKIAAFLHVRKVWRVIQRIMYWPMRLIDGASWFT